MDKMKYKVSYRLIQGGVVYGESFATKEERDRAIERYIGAGYQIIEVGETNEK